MVQINKILDTLTEGMKQIKNLNTEIIKVLKKSKNPISTRELALSVSKAWHSVLTRCLRLQIDGKVTGFKAGNMHLWSLNKK
ncbi:MAG: hypothetical protein KAK00_00010 [Nanoarchaeota archaeon]|nr:hypothetical protein [Nanoarchaeota archaeon]